MRDTSHAQTLGAEELVRGFMYTHNRANQNTAEVHKTGAALQAAIEILIERGLIDADEWQARRDAAGEKLRSEYLDRGMAVAVQDFDVSKYEFTGGATIDCDDRLELCQAACCRLPFALSKEDVQENVVKWDLGHPYLNVRNADGYCVHLDRKTRHCGIYDCRPIPCRGYDCRQDKRIWLDFEKRVINPALMDPDWPEGLERNAK